MDIDKLKITEKELDQFKKDLDCMFENINLEDKSIEDQKDLIVNSIINLAESFEDRIVEDRLKNKVYVVASKEKPGLFYFNLE